MHVESYIKSGSASQPQRLVLAAGESLDDAQASGKWIASEKAVRPDEWR